MIEAYNHHNPRPTSPLDTLRTALVTFRTAEKAREASRSTGPGDRRVQRADAALDALIDECRRHGWTPQGRLGAITWARLTVEQAEARLTKPETETQESV